MFYTSPLMARHGIQAVFSDRQGGVSKGAFESLNLGFGLGDEDAHVRHNLHMLCQMAGMPSPHQARQVHGTQVLVCSGASKHHEQDADILIAREQGVALAVRTADCLPVLLADKQAGVIAAVHAGWRGTVARIVEQALARMLAYGAEVERIQASLGPYIAPCCFAVSDDVAEQLCDACSQNVTLHQDGKTYADLAKANHVQLLSFGVNTENIELSRHCTACCKQPGFFSYRRDKGKTGRQLSMICLS